MGLERMVSIIQDAPTNFETDLFMPIIREVEQISGVKYGHSQENDVAFKVIADHIRTVAFAIGDGALPSNEGRGYICVVYFAVQYVTRKYLQSMNHLCTN